MARNGSGTYSKVNTFVASNTITASGHNQNWDDLVSEMTNSVAVDGQSTMTGPLKASNGSAAAPSWTFGSDLDSGFYRITANSIGLSLDGVLRIEFTTASISVVTALSLASTLRVVGASTLTGNVAAGGTLGVTSDFAVNTNKFTVAAASGNTVAAGTLNSGGLLTASAGLTVVGAVTLPAASVALAALATKPAVVLIQTQAASSSATIDFTTGLDDTLYDSFEIRFSNVKPATDDVSMQVLIGTGGGPTYQTAGYRYSGSGIVDTPASALIGNPSAAAISFNAAGAGVGVGNASGENMSGCVKFDNPEVSDIMVLRFEVGWVQASSANAWGGGSGMLAAAGATTGIRFKFSSGNIASGRFSLYGYVKA